MLNKRSIILYWLLILLPAFMISISAFKLLFREQERMNKMATATARERARAIAETLQVTVEAVEDELTEALYRIPEQRMLEILLEWRRSNPLVRNVFIWESKSNLRYPLPGIASTSEERRFVLCFNGLFSGRIPWPSETEFDMDESFAENITISSSMNSPDKTESYKKSSLVQDIRKLKAGRQELVSIAEGKDLSSSNNNTKRKKTFFMTGSWIPWFSENRLYILGWVKKRPAGPVYGVEMELMSLLSRLITHFPETPAENSVYALMDDSGQVLHQTGGLNINPALKADFTISLAPQLPHWEIAMYTKDKSPTLRSGREFILLSGLLLLIFISAIIIGGTLLTWQAHRNITDARQKTSFVSNVSHELKTPLTSIRMYAELLFEGRIKNPDKKKHYLQVIVSESQRLTRLVNNVLDFGRLEQGRKKYHCGKLDMLEYLKVFAKSHGLRIKEAGMKLKMELPEEDIVVWTDRDAIEQVLLNLLDNAIKYADSGEELNISLKRNKEVCEIHIEDRGPGVPDAHKEKIFEKFHRVDDALTSKHQGSGLGLSISRRIVKGLGGALLYKPAGGGGSCFIVRLPFYSTDSSDMRIVKGGKHGK
ncbi:MAG: HAMP domain-containing sensor histidine kinase [Thermodesulfobacteriota bacterium]|nr:HAMP domain-containing sensor histidine kinase [Thermodesulfobacteriota bacterium]